MNFIKWFQKWTINGHVYNNPCGTLSCLEGHHIQYWIFHCMLSSLLAKLSQVLANYALSCSIFFHPGELLESFFAGYVPLFSQNPLPIVVYCVANYRPHFSHFWVNVIYLATFCLCIYLIKPFRSAILKWTGPFFSNSWTQKTSPPQNPKNVFVTSF